MKKYFLTFLLLILCLMGGTVVHANEMVPGCRWNNVIGGKCYVRLNDDYVSGPWAGFVDDAIGNWNSQSGSKVSVSSSSFNQSNLDVFLSTVEPFPGGEQAYGLTFIYDENGNEIDTSGLTTDQYGSKISHASVALNPDFETGTPSYAETTTTTTQKNKNRIKTITHEIGHCLNLGHRDSDVSIMHPGWNLDWTNYEDLQAIDREDLENYY